MPRPTTRTLTVALGVGLLAPALATLPSQAVEGSQDLSLTDCEVIRDPFFANTRVSDDGTWAASVKLEHPSPVPVGSGQTASLTLGAIPTADLPEELTNVDVSVFVLVEDGRGFEFTLQPRTVQIPTVTPGTPLSLGEQDVDDLTYGDSDHYDLAVKDITIGFFGDTSGDTREYYEYSCDQLVSGAPLVSVGVFDPAAPAQIFVDAFSATQGRARSRPPSAVSRPTCRRSTRSASSTASSSSPSSRPRASRRSGSPTSVRPRPGSSRSSRRRAR